MNVNEIDRRIGPLQDVMAGVEAGLQRIHGRLEEESWYDGLHALDDSEPLLGVAFVAAQIYIEGTVGDIWRLRNNDTPIGDRQSKRLLAKWLPRGKVVVPGIARVQLIYAVANYYKHHESAYCPRPHVLRTLRVAGIAANATHPCSRAANILCGEGMRLRALCEIVREWRRHAMSMAKKVGSAR
jgi:hypothetical protein